MARPQFVPGATYHENRPDLAVRRAEPAWIKELDPKDLLVFVHVPKAGGTSLNAILWQVYGRRYVNYHSRLSKWSPQSISRRRANEILAIGGHNGFGFHKSFGPGWRRWLLSEENVFVGRRVRYISVVRNPLDRLKSYYRFATTFRAYALHKKVKGLSPTDFFRVMEEVGNTEFRNQQCRLVGRSNVFEAARQRVITDYHAVAALEDFVPMVKHLAKTLRWPDVYDLKQRNQSPKGEEEEGWTDELVDWIKRNNSEDLQLYDFARSEGMQYWKD
jgi:hypothetical protein